MATNNAANNIHVPAAQAAPCRTVPLLLVPGMSRRELARCPLPAGDSPEELAESFMAAPQFKGIDTTELLRRGKNGLRVILLGENSYYSRQAAAYLAAMHADPDKEKQEEADSFWDDLELDSSLPVPAGEDGTDAENSMLVISPELLDPTAAMTDTAKMLGGGQMMARPREVDPADLDSVALLVSADSGIVLTETVVNKIESFIKETGRDVFIALKSSQMELELMEELRFSLGFQLCRVGCADEEYLRNLFCHIAAEKGLRLGADVQPEKVISALRRYRGSAFNECDMEKLLSRAGDKSGKKLLHSADLMISPCRPAESRGMDVLQSMAGLQGIKDTVKRLLASYIMEDRRRMMGSTTEPSYRNLAFSGPPGTGKSITARLVAGILREAGCGTGRFVEAGREQLIGAYLGQTSPMVAELFKKARGGVLFIDEAGSLLAADGSDMYAAEAVNALVRHMELNPETMVIFATYPGEMRALLASNPGLSSRVSQIIDFPAYSETELCEIFRSFAKKEQLILPEGADKLCTEFFVKLKTLKGDSFGNGREARRLFQSAKEELALRVMETDSDCSLALEDIEKAKTRLLSQEKGEEKRSIGFCV